MASQGVRRRPEDFSGIRFLSYTTELPDSDSDLSEPIKYVVTIEDGDLWIWTKGRRKGLPLYYGQMVRSLKLIKET